MTPNAVFALPLATSSLKCNVNVRLRGEILYPTSRIRAEMVSLRSNTDELDEMNMPDIGLPFSGASSISTAGEGDGSDRNASRSRIEDGGVGGQVEYQFCMVGMELPNWFSTDEREWDETELDAMEEGMLSASEIWDVAESRFGTTRGVAGNESVSPNPVSG